MTRAAPSSIEYSVWTWRCATLLAAHRSHARGHARPALGRHRRNRIAAPRQVQPLAGDAATCGFTPRRLRSGTIGCSSQPARSAVTGSGTSTSCTSGRFASSRSCARGSRPRRRTRTRTRSPARSRRARRSRCATSSSRLASSALPSRRWPAPRARRSRPRVSWRRSVARCPRASPRSTSARATELRLGLREPDEHRSRVHRLARSPGLAAPGRSPSSDTSAAAFSPGRSRASAVEVRALAHGCGPRRSAPASARGGRRRRPGRRRELSACRRSRRRARRPSTASRTNRT